MSSGPAVLRQPRLPILSLHPASRVGWALCAIGVLLVGWVGVELSPAHAQQLNRVSSEVVERARADLHGPGLRGKDGPLARVGLRLALLYREREAHEQRKAAAPFRSQAVSNVALSGERVTIDATARPGRAQALATRLRSLGAVGVSRFGSVVSAQVPIDRIPDLAASTALAFARGSVARTSRRAVPASRRAMEAPRGKMVGSTTTQGDVAMNTNDVRSQFGIDGTGITVGVLSDSYDTSPTASTSAADDIASGDLPPASDILVIDDPITGSDEGRAMMQLIYDVAPGTALSFHTAFGGQANFANGIIELRDAGADVIVDDVFSFFEPFFQDGVIAQAVDIVTAVDTPDPDDGIPYFSAAGNRADQSYESDATNFVPPSGSPTSYDAVYDFDPTSAVDTLQQVIVPVGQDFTLSFQWDDPYFSVTGDPAFAADTDLDIYLVDKNGEILVSAVNNNLGGDPIEVFGFQNDGSIDADGDDTPDTTFSLYIRKVTGPDAGRVKYVYSGSLDAQEYATNSPTTFGHYNSAGGSAVAAAFWGVTPEFGEDPAQPESFTSLGGNALLFNLDGTRKPVPEVREQPKVTAPDGGNTTFFGGLINFPPDTDTFPNFFGTSAAAPHAAALAALQLQADASLSPTDVYDAQAAGADDITGFTYTTVGYDFLTGAGFVDALNTITSVSGMPDLVLTPTSVDLGTLFFDSGSGTTFVQPTIDVRVENGGSGPLDITDVTLSGSAFAFTGGTDIPTGPLAVSEEILATLEFAPTATGTFSETLEIDSDDPDTPTATLTLDAEAVLPPVAAVTETEVFEAVETGQTATQQVTVSNSSAETALDYDIFAQASGIGPFPPDEVAFPPTAASLQKTQRLSSTLLPTVPGRSPKSNPALDPSAFLYTLDDGTVESSRGFADGLDTFWLNAFQAQEGATTVTAIGTAFFNQLPVGSDVHFLLYEDPNDDGDPTDAVLLEDVQTLSEVSGGSQIQVEPIPPTQVDDVFFVAVLVSQGPAFPTPLDTSTPSQGASWISAADTGTFDVTDLSGGATQNAISAIPENWVLRAQGSFVAFDPISGSVPSGGSEAVDLIFDGTSLAVDTYAGDVSVRSNDPVTPQTDVPFDFFVANAVGEVADLNADGAYAFDDTGVALDLTGVSGSGTVTAARFDVAPSSTDGIDPALNVSPYRWIVVQDGDLQFDGGSTLRFERSAIPNPGFDDITGPDVDVYRRSPFGTGTFAALTSAYDDGGTSDLADDAIEATGSTGFSEFVFASDDAPLPVELAAFDVETDQDAVVVTWTTLRETTNKGFQIQQREEATSTWTDAGSFVEGAGTTTEPRSYSQRIEGLGPGTYRFRLLQVDVDGTASPSIEQSVTVRITDRFTITRVRPNPVSQHGSLTLSVRDAQPVRVAVYNVLGQRVRVLLEETVAAQTQRRIDLNADGLSSGIYFVRVTGQEFQATEKLSIIR